MDLITAIESRRSIRAYKDTPVKDEDIAKLLDLAQKAPNVAGNWHFTVIRNKEFLKEISEANRKIMLASGNPKNVAKAEDPNFDCFWHAPCAIVLSCDVKFPGGDASITMAGENICLAAQELGLATCFMGSSNMCMLMPGNEEIVKRFELPENYVPLFSIALGYPAQEAGPRPPAKPNTVKYID